MRQNKIAICAMIFLMLMLILSACQSTTEKPITLTVEYPYPNEFYKRYGSPFEHHFPLIHIQVIPKADQTSTADIRYFNSLSAYKELSDSGGLLHLEPLIQQEPSQWKNISPIMTDILTFNTENGLYGLAPSFSSCAIFYNKDLFAKYKIPLPKNRSTWGGHL